MTVADGRRVVGPSFADSLLRRLAADYCVAGDRAKAMGARSDPAPPLPSSGRVLGPDQLRRLAGHRYSAEGQSLMDPYMQHFWGWLVRQIPTWWAPNALTLAGLIVNGSTTFMLMIFSADARVQVLLIFISVKITPNLRGNYCTTCLGIMAPPVWEYRLTSLGIMAPTCLGISLHFFGNYAPPPIKCEETTNYLCCTD